MPGDPIVMSASRTIVPTGGAQVSTEPVTITIIAPDHVDPSFISVRIEEVRDEATGEILFEATGDNDAAAAEWGTLSELRPDMTFDYFPPDLVLRPYVVRIIMTAPNAAVPSSIARLIIGDDEFEVGNIDLTLVPSDSPLHVVATASPASITVDGNGGTDATTSTLRAEITGGTAFPASALEPYTVVWTMDGMRLTPDGISEPVLLEDTDLNGQNDTIFSERNVTANEIRDLLGVDPGNIGDRIFHVAVQDGEGAVIHDVASINVNAPLAVAASMEPDVFVGGGELRVDLRANASGGVGQYTYEWTSSPVIPGLFDEIDTTQASISVRAKDIGTTQISFTVDVTDGAGNTASSTAERGVTTGIAGGGGAPAAVPNELVVDIDGPPTCVMAGATAILLGTSSGGVAPVDYEWVSGSCGAFIDPESLHTIWAAPNTPGQTCALTLTAEDQNGLRANPVTIAVRILAGQVRFAKDSSVPEDAGVHPIDVVLELGDVGASCVLTQEVTVDIVDTGTGTATPGEDYTPLAVPTTVVFPVGSAHGAVQTYDLVLADDSDVENDETVILALENPTGGVFIDEPINHTVGITIEDNDTADLVIDDVVVAEDAGTATFTVSLEVAAAGEINDVVTVDYVTQDGTATSTSPNEDYVPTSGSLTFTPGGPMAIEIDIPINDDVVVENDETFLVTLVNVTGPAEINTPQGTGTITDNDTDLPAVLLTKTGVAMKEGNTKTYKVSLNTPPTEPVTVTISADDQLLVEYDGSGEVSSVEVVFDDTNYSDKQTITVRAVEDGVTEGPHTGLVTHTVASADLDYNGIAIPDVVASIRDDDEADIVVDPTSLVLTEGGAGGTYQLTIATSPTNKVEVFITEDSELIVTPNKVTFAKDAPAGTTETVTVEVRDDDDVEGPHTGLITHRSESVDPNYNNTVIDDVVVEIIDDETPTLSLEPTDGLPEGDSGTGTAVFTVTLSPPSEQIVTVDYRLNNDSATTGDDDYVDSNGTLEFLPGQTQAQFSVTFNGDTKIEDDEQFEVELRNASNAALGVATQLFTIINDDSTLVTVEPVTLVEGSGGGKKDFVFTVMLSQPSEDAVTVDYTTDDAVGDLFLDAATEGDDYADKTGTLTFNPGHTAKTITVKVDQDDLDEPNEAFVLRLTNPTGGAAFLGGSTELVALGTILDDDGLPVLSVDQPGVKGEGAGSITFKVRLLPATSQPVTVVASTEDGTATVADDDYVATTETLTFNPGETQMDLEVPINNDAIDEGPDDDANAEYFLVELSSPTNAVIAAGGETAEGRIRDNDGAVPAVLLTKTDLEMKEGNAKTYKVSLNTPPTQPVTVTIAADHQLLVEHDGSGPVPSVEVVFDDTNYSDKQTITVTAVEDGVTEGVHTGLVTHAAASADLDYNGIAIADMVVQINDNDEADILVIPASLAMTEGDTAQYELVINTSPTNKVEVFIIEDDQLRVTPNKVTFAKDAPAGTTQTVDVEVRDDSNVEGPHIGVIMHRAESVDPNYNNIVIDDAVVDITDNDTPTLNLLAAASLPEGDTGTGTAVLTVTLTPASDEIVTVDYRVNNDTATVGDGDYVDTDGTLEFLPGDTSEEILVTFNGDTKVEDDEQFEVELRNATNADLGTSTQPFTIVNDDSTVLSIDDVTLVEGSGGGKMDFEFTVSLSKASEAAVTVDYDTDDAVGNLYPNEATEGDDYDDKNGSLTFNPGQTEKTITVKVKQDDLDEPNEAFVLRLTAPTGGAAFPGGAAELVALGTILDDDGEPVLSVDQPNAKNEGVGSITFKVRLLPPTSQPVTVVVSTEDGTATVSDGDYEARTETLTFAPGETLVDTFAVNVIDDDVDEGPNDAANAEIFFAELSAPTNATIAAGGEVAEGRIRDNDGLPVLRIADVVVEEGDGGQLAAIFAVTLDEPTDQTVTVDYETVDGNELPTDGTIEEDDAAAPGDYAAATGTVRFVPGDTSELIVVQVNGDILAEEDEEFSLLLSEFPENAKYQNNNINGRSAQCTIVDNDVVTLSIDDVTVDETAGTADFTIKLSSPIADNRPGLEFNIDTYDDTATAGDDYDAYSDLLTFPADNTTVEQTVSVVILDDDLACEGDETFEVELSNVRIGGAIVPGALSSGDGLGVGTINDDEALPELTIFDAPVVTEGGTASFEVTLDGACEEPVTVFAVTQDGTATVAGGDYEPTIELLTFNPFETKTFTVDTLDDGLDEDGDAAVEETFLVNLIDPVNATVAVAQGEGLIADDDDPVEVSLSGNVTVEEADAGRMPTVWTLTLDAPSDVPVTVGVVTVDGDGGANADAVAGDDYVALDTDVTFAPGEMSKQVIVHVKGDNRYELKEGFTVMLTDPVNVLIAGAGESYCRIARNDVPVVSIDADVTKSEGSNGGTKNFRFKVRLSNPPDASTEPITVEFDTGSGIDTATGGDDYDEHIGTVVEFFAGDKVVPVDVAVFKDNDDEPDEFFTVGLSNKSDGTWGVQERRGYIIDNDNEPRLMITAVADGGEPNIDAEFEVELLGLTDQEVTVNWSTISDSALAGGDPALAEHDYDADSGTLTFAPGDTIKVIAIDVNNDALYEDEERFFVQLDSPVNATIVTNGDANMAEGVIVDDETEPTVDIDDEAVMDEADAGADGTADAVFTVSLSNPSAYEVTVQYDTTPGSATPGVDYAPASGTVVFAPGQATQDVVVNVFGDLLDEGPNNKANAETLLVDLSNPVNAGLGIGQGTGMIKDDDAPPTMVIYDNAVIEGNTPDSVEMDLYVMLDAPSALTVTVQYETRNSGSAKATKGDFVATSGLLTFLPGETLAQFAVEVLGDDLNEYDENLRVRLSSADNATIGDNTGDGWILNDDAEPHVTVGSVSRNEGSGGGTKNFPFEVMLSAPSGRDVYVAIITADGTATAPADYLPKAELFTIGAGNTSKNFRVEVVKDDLAEADEVFYIGIAGADGATFDAGGVPGSSLGIGTIEDNDSATP